MNGIFCFNLFFAFIFGVVHASTAEDVITNAELLSRIQALETEGKWMKQIIMEQKEELSGLKTVVETQQDALEKQDQTIKDLQECKQRRVEKDDSPKEEGSEGVTSSKQETERTNERSFSNAEKIAKRLALVSDGPVAFHAVITKGAVPTLGVKQRIVFDVVQMNLGGGYHNLHGLFIAPAPGVYIFSVTILSSEHNDGALDVSLMKNGAVLANALADATDMSWNQGAATVVTQLATADEVWVQHVGSTAPNSLWGDYYTSFMGCLVVPL